MILAGRRRDPRQALTGAALGVYAAAAALMPGRAGKAFLAAPLLVLPIVWSILSTPNGWLVFFFGCALLAPPLPFALGDTGPHVALLFAGAGLLVGLLRLSEWRIAIDPLSVSLATLWAILLASVSMAAIYSGGALAAARFARVLILGISV